MTVRCLRTHWFSLPVSSLHGQRTADRPRWIRGRLPAVTRALCLLALVLVPAALAGSAADPGVSDDSILIGGTAPLSGEASSAAAVARGADAYFKYVNDRGGVNGRKIEYKVLDDAYDPARTIQDVRQLVQQDRVFAMFNTLGTSNNLAIRDFLNQSSVPQLFVASGATTWGRDFKKYPWTIGYIPSYQTEGIVLARNVAEDEAGREDRRPLPGRRLRQGSPRRLQARARQEGGPDREGGRLRPDRRGRELTGVGAACVEGDRLHGLRVRQVRDPVDDPGGQARLASAGLRERGRVLELADVDRRPDRGEVGDAQRDLDRLLQGPERPEVGEGRRDQADAVDRQEIRRRERPEERLLRRRAWRRRSRWSTRCARPGRT